MRLRVHFWRLLRTRESSLESSGDSISSEPQDRLKDQGSNGLRERLWASRQANYENLDKAILSLSSGALVLSMAFFKDVVPIEQAVGIDILFLSWICLG